jgi:hypothetical protein
MTGSDGGATIAQQSVEQLGGRSSILFKQRDDHARLDRLMDRARTTRAARGREHSVVLRAVARLVFSHAFAEESVLFPAVRQVLPEGDPLTLHIETAHQQVNELVTCLDASSGDEAGHTALLERAFVALDEDVRSEEDELLPRLQQLLSPRQLRALGRRWELVRRIAPTRPHPLVSRRPPGQVLSALPLTVLDRGRDRLQWLDEATSGRWSGRLAMADRALAAAAGAVERFPLLRRGERAATRKAAGDSGS